MDTETHQHDKNKLLDTSHESNRAERDKLVRAQINMLDKYQIIRNPNDPRLYAPNRRVKDPRKWEQEARTLVGHMMIERGVGLAACQMGLNIRMFCVKAPDMNKVIVFFNADLDKERTELLNHQDELQWDEEGCVSHPGIWVEVARLPKIAFRASTLTEPRERLYYGSGMFARIVQHEIDHTNKRLITDLGIYKRNVRVDPVGQDILFGTNRHADEHGFAEPESD